MRGRFFAVGLASLALSLGASACGSDENPAQEYASAVCSSIGDWRADVEANIDEFRENPGAISADSIRDAAEETRSSTEALLDELRALGAPETESGEEAKQEVEQYVESLRERADRVSEAVDASEEGVAGTLALVASVVAEVEGATADGRETLQEIRELDPDGELQQAFEDEDACDALQE